MTGAADGPIADFWVWWAARGQAAAAAGIDGASFDAFTEEICDRVEAIDRGLSWELAPGRQAQHALIVTAGGVPELRRRAERWFRHAPAMNATWEYHPARMRDSQSLGSVMEFAGLSLDLTRLSFDLRIDQDRHLIDAVVFHPQFGRMSETDRAQVGFLALDWALGEDGVTRCIGQFSTTCEPPPAGVPADGLTEIADALAGRESDPRWALLTGERDGYPVLAAVRRPARWIDHPLLDQHLSVTLPFADQSAGGAPDPDALGRLRGAEDEIAGRLAPRVLLVAHETSRGIRELHFYADSDDGEVAGLVRDIVSDWPGAEVTTSADAGWRAIRRLTG